MKVSFTVEDTPEGIRVNGDWVHSGVSDHPTLSVALMAVTGFVEQLKAQQRAHALNIIWHNNNENHPTR